MKISDENMKRLDVYKDVLLRIHNEQSTTSFGLIPSFKKDLADIYKKVTGVRQCSTCSNGWLLKLAKIYVDNKNI